MKIGVFIALIAGVFVVNPAIPFPAFTEFTGEGACFAWSGLAVYFDYDRLRGDFRFPRVCRFRHDAEDA